MSKFNDLGFNDPWHFNHCVPLAFTAAREDRSTEFAISLAKSARTFPNPDAPRLTLLSMKGGSTSYNPPSLAWVHAWANLAGLRVMESYEPSRAVESVRVVNIYGRRRYRAMRRLALTLEQFRHERGAAGMWIVMTYCHAQAVVDGVVRGFHKPRSRVTRAWRVEVIA